MYQKPHRFVWPTLLLVQWWLHPPWVVSFQDALRCLPPRHDTWSQRSGSRKLRFYQSQYTPGSLKMDKTKIPKMDTNEKKQNKEECFGHKETRYIVKLSWCHCYLFLCIFFCICFPSFKDLQCYRRFPWRYHAHLHCHITLLQQQRDGDGLHRRHPFEAHLGNKALRALTKKGEGPYGSTTLICQWIYIYIYTYILLSYHGCI